MVMSSRRLDHRAEADEHYIQKCPASQRLTDILNSLTNRYRFPFVMFTDSVAFKGEMSDLIFFQIE